MASKLTRVGVHGDPCENIHHRILSKTTWDNAIQVVSQALTKNKPEEIAFLFGLTSDHLADLVIAMAAFAGSPGSSTLQCL